MLLNVLFALLAPQTPRDTVIAVPPDTRLEVPLSAGTVEVDTWDRDAVQIVAIPERGGSLAAELQGRVLRVLVRTPGGGIDLARLHLTVPRRMSLTLGRGGDLDVIVRGAQGSVDATIGSGKIDVEGGLGAVLLRSFDGAITLRGARASVTIETTMGPIRVADVVGEVDASSNSNHVTLENVDTRNLRVKSISGTIRFRGPLHPDGRYTLIGHSGSVFVTSPLPINATVAVASVSGAFTSPLPYTVIERQRSNIFTARFGNGSAQVSMESFIGGLVLDGIRP